MLFFRKGTPVIAALLSLSPACTLARSEDVSCSELTQLLKNARDGDPEAEFTLAEFHFSGHCVAQNIEGGAQWLARSARHDYGPAQGLMAMMFHKEGEDEEAMRLARLAAEKGDANGEGLFGFLYLKTRKSDPSSDDEAIKWIRHSAERGNGLGQMVLAEMYYNGSVVTKNDIEADKWYILAEKSMSRKDKERDAAVNPFTAARTLLESNMTQSDVTEARHRADAWNVRKLPQPSYNVIDCWDSTHC